jgi:hypothetical protein
MKAILKAICKNSLPLVLEVLAGISVKGWSVYFNRDAAGKIDQVCVTKIKT